MIRTSVVDNIRINIVQFSSLAHIGDVGAFTPRVKVLAVQREVSYYQGKEGNFNYFAFRMPLPLPLLNEQVSITTRNEDPVIRVGNIKVLGTAFSSMVQIGKLCDKTLESRTKHIRKLLPRDNEAVASQVTASDAAGR